MPVGRCSFQVSFLVLSPPSFEIPWEVDKRKSTRLSQLLPPLSLHLRPPEGGAQRFVRGHRLLDRRGSLGRGWGLQWQLCNSGVLVSIIDDVMAP